MKKEILLIVCSCAWLVCFGGYSPDIIKAMAQDKSRIIGETNGAKAREVLRVVDQDGIPVTDARIYGSFWPGDNGRNYILVDGVTNSDGEYIAEGMSKWKLTYQVTKTGYYMSTGAIDYLAATNIPVVLNGKWQPYGSTRKIVLKKIKNPNKIHAFPLLMGGYRIPKFDEWIGFDFECNEWISPYGEGRFPDVLLRFSAKRKGLHDYRFVMDVSFTNNPYAGGYQMEADKTSELATTYIADSNAAYRTSFSYVKEQSPGVKRHWDILDRDSYIVFRTRTRVDAHGKLVGAHYGKILGQWFSDKEYMTMRDGCFNPVENDVNIEDGGALRNTIRNRNRKHGRDEVSPCANLK